MFPPGAKWTTLCSDSHSRTVLRLGEHRFEIDPDSPTIWDWLPVLDQMWRAYYEQIAPPENPEDSDS